MVAFIVKSLTTSDSDFLSDFNSSKEAWDYFENKLWQMFLTNGWFFFGEYRVGTSWFYTFMTSHSKTVFSKMYFWTDAIYCDEFSLQ